MGLIQNKVTVSQPNSHVVVKNAGGLRGLTGETGPQGPQGVPGQAATVTAGTTTTLPAGSDATVQNVGSTSAAIFNFGIPKGDKGDTGETGTAATISVGTTTTLEPGEDATVTNSGTRSAAVFDFGIPKGAKGDTGSQGPAGQDGADGFSPTATVTKTGDTATITITDKDGTTTAQISDGVTPTIDPALSPTSENPVQNKVVTNALAGKADKPIVVSSLPATGTAGQEYFVDDRYNTVTELKGDTEQTTYSGKNLLDLAGHLQSSSNGIVPTYSADGTLKLAGTATATWAYVTTEFAVNLPAGTYEFSIGGTLSHRIYIYFKLADDSTGYWIINAGSTTATMTFTQTVSTFRVELSAMTNGQTYNESITPMVESGRQATSFEPYVGGTASPNPDYPQEVKTVTGEQTITVSNGQGESQVYPINLGKNLFNIDGDLSYGGYPISPTNNGDGTLTTTANYNSQRASGQKLNLEPNTTYTVSGKLVSHTGTGDVSVAEILSGTIGGVTVIKREYITTDGAFSYSVTTPNDVSKLWVSFSSIGADTQATFGDIQIEKGSTATTYAPYFTPIELCKIGTYQDYIYKSGDDWYVHKEIKNLDMSTITDWQARGVAGDFYRTQMNTTYGVQKGIKLYSNIFTYSTTSWSIVGFGINASNDMWIHTGDSALTSQNDVPQWLANRGAIMYGVMVTPTDTQITNATLIAQLEALAGAKIMVDGGTAIVTSQYLPAILTTAYNSDSGYIDYIYDGTNFVKVR